MMTFQREYTCIEAQINTDKDAGPDKAYPRLGNCASFGVIVSTIQEAIGKRACKRPDQVVVDGFHVDGLQLHICGHVNTGFLQWRLIYQTTEECPTTECAWDQDQD